MTARRGQLNRYISSRGLISYEIELAHDGLHKHRIIKGNDPLFVQRKVEVQLAEWEDQWRRKRAAQSRTRDANLRRTEREKKQQYQEEQKEQAAERTAEASQIIDDLQNTLQHTLSRNDAIDWEQLKDHSDFPKPRPRRPTPPQRPTPAPVPQEPLRSAPRYQPQLGLADKLFSSRREKKEAEATRLFEQDHQQWEAARQQILSANATKERAYQEQIGKAEEELGQAVRSWEEERAAYLQQQQEQNASVDQQKEQYLTGTTDAVLSYCDMVLARSEYPDFFPKEWELDFNPETGVLVVDYSLPSPGDVPTLIEVKYVASKDDFSEKHISESQRTKLYDDLLYQVALRTVHELYEADVIDAIKNIVFNGYVHSIDRGTGKEVNACVLSLQTTRDSFMAINLANVDPKTCFKQLKGVGSSKLHSVTPVAPIVNIRRDDGRFVSSYDVAHHLDEGYNLASMDWQDFEHLIREVFGKEFSSAGGEVKITQASRDGGVDAVAFDPDPIRGGKIVIQAKRYTATVGVAAVRDLYGTVMNEGATKGILVTTSDYGPDAYEFANGKPLTLLNGSNLLHLLEKHGHKAKIDLREARQEALGRKVK
jgi:restriction system protein